MSTATGQLRSTSEIVQVAAVPAEQLHQRLGWQEQFDPPPGFGDRDLVHLNMEQDDAPLLRYLFRCHQPMRHLEFGTWLGHGTLCCLTECHATVWTINLPHGETHPDGRWAYPRTLLPQGHSLAGDSQQPSDAIGVIGCLYREQGLAHRVCQIYCDSRDWDTNNYPPHFFDSVFVDGGHDEATVQSDTQKSRPLLRPGGLMIWHDYCPIPEVQSQCSSTRGVVAAIDRMLNERAAVEFADLFWIEPSWLLVGVKQ